MDLVLRMYLWWRLCPLYLGCTSVGLYVSCIYSHARWVTVGDSRLCWCLCDVSRALINSLVCWFCQLYLGEMQSLRAVLTCIWVKCSHWAVLTCIWVKCSHWELYSLVFGWNAVTELYSLVFGWNAVTELYSLVFGWNTVTELYSLVVGWNAVTELCTVIFG